MYDPSTKNLNFCQPNRAYAITKYFDRPLSINSKLIEDTLHPYNVTSDLCSSSKYQFVLKAIVDSFFDIHDNVAQPNKYTIPLVLFLDYFSRAQSTSQCNSRDNLLVVYINPKFIMPLTNQNISLIATMCECLGSCMTIWKILTSYVISSLEIVR